MNYRPNAKWASGENQPRRWSDHEIRGEMKQEITCQIDPSLQFRDTYVGENNTYPNQQFSRPCLIQRVELLLLLEKRVFLWGERERERERETFTI